MPTIQKLPFVLHELRICNNRGLLEWQYHRIKMILAKFVKKIDLFTHKLRFSKVGHDAEIEQVAMYFVKSERTTRKMLAQLFSMFSQVYGDDGR